MSKPPNLPREEDGFYAKVSGDSYKNDDGTPRQQIIRDFAHAGSDLVLVREPKNKYDKNAIAVWLPVQTIFSKKQFKIGYIDAGTAIELAELMDNEGEVSAKISSISGEDQKRLGVNIFITIVKDRVYKKE